MKSLRKQPAKLEWDSARAVLARLREIEGVPQELVATDQAAVVEELRARLRWTTEPASAHEIGARQQESLRRIVAAAAAFVPFYRRSLPADVDPFVFERCPFLLKSDLRDHWQQLVSGEYDGTLCDRKRTSGTTGVPITIIQSEAESFATLHYDAARVASLAGFDRFERWASPYVVAITDNPAHSPFATWNPIIDKWCRFELIDPMVPENGREVLRVVESLEPAFLVSRPSALRLLAQEAARGTDLDRTLPLPIVSSGANLYADDRMLVESVLNARVTDLYALSECSGVASQCSHGGYHVHWESAYVEIVDPDGGAEVEPGAPGEIVVTDLARRAMPIVRYRAGDFGRRARGPCPCGVAGPVLEAIDGREGCYFRLADGRLFNPVVMNKPLSKVAALDQYRMTQTGIETVMVEYVCQSDRREEVEARVRAVVADLLPSAFSIALERVEQIAPLGSKVERYVSLLERRRRSPEMRPVE